LLGMRVRSRRGHGYLSLVSVVLFGRGICVGLITRSEESYSVWCVQWVWSLSPVRGVHDPESGQSAAGKITEPASAEIFHESCGAQDSDKRNALYLWRFNSLCLERLYLSLSMDCSTCRSLSIVLLWVFLGLFG